MSQEQNLSRLSFMRNSVIIFFAVGFLLLLVPLALVVVWNQFGCTTGSLSHSVMTTYCPSVGVFKSAYSLFPFLMLIGGVLVGYNLKRISDSLLPPRDDDEESENEEKP